MQRNWRTEYFKNLIKDKTRTKRWRKVLLCLSCVVVFWTVYALILPAITLESKKCNIEEHTHKETKAPKGYNLLKDAIAITIDTNGKITINEGDVTQVDVQNNAGSLLPSTGGMGTTIFYIAGALLVLISGVVLIAKKRTDSK